MYCVGLRGLKVCVNAVDVVNCVGGLVRILEDRTVVTT